MKRKKSKTKKEKMVNVQDILHPKKTISKTAKIGFVKQHYVNIPKEIANFLHIKKGDLFVFMITIPKTTERTIRKEFRIIHQDKKLRDKKEEIRAKLESIDVSKSYDGFDKSIIRALVLARRERTTLQISEEIGMHWSTVRKHLEKLEKKKIVRSQKFKNRIYWNLK